MPSCLECGQENPDVARFCLACGTPLADSGVAREERKVVTVLFADLVGFTSRAEQLDPEDVRAMLSPYYARLRKELERRRVLAFYRSVDAKAYLQEGEALLAQTA